MPPLKPHESHVIDESSLFGSLGYNHYRSNFFNGNFFNSNTFLNGGVSINDEEQELKSGNEKL